MVKTVPCSPKGSIVFWVTKLFDVPVHPVSDQPLFVSPALLMQNPPRSHSAQPNAHIMEMS